MIIYFNRIYRYTRVLETLLIKYKPIIKQKAQSFRS